jgi:hypothetical protein
MAKFTFGLFAFTAILALFAGVQAWAFIQSERAFVAPAEANFLNWPLVPRENPLIMYIEMRNSGKSTATIEELSVSITHELPETPQYYEAQKVAFAPIVPGGSSWRSLRFITAWPQETIDKIVSGSLKFYIFGVIRYWDGFSIRFLGPKATGFCFRYEPQPQTSPAVFETCRERAYTFVH